MVVDTGPAQNKKSLTTRLSFFYGATDGIRTHE